MKVHVHIGRLVRHGGVEHGEAAIRNAVTSELARLLGGAPANTRPSGAEAVGRQVAQAVHARMGGLAPAGRPAGGGDR